MGQKEFSEEEDRVWEGGKNFLRRRKTGTRSMATLGVVGGAWSVAEAKVTVVGAFIRLKRGRGIHVDGEG